MYYIVFARSREVQPFSLPIVLKEYAPFQDSVADAATAPRGVATDRTSIQSGDPILHLRKKAHDNVILHD
jgi:hypothetical protein